MSNILIFPYARALRNGKNNAKNFPFWPELICLLKEHTITQLGVEGEVQLVPDFRKNLPLDELRSLIKKCDFWISVDSWAPHLAQHEDKKGIVIWSVSDPHIFGYPNNVNILKDRTYLRKNQFALWEDQEFDAEAFPSVLSIYEQVMHYFSSKYNINH